MRTLSRGIALTALLLCASCSKDPDNNAPPLPDMGEVDEGNNTPEPDMSDPSDPDESCVPVEVLPTTTMLAEREFFETDETSEVSCGVGGARDGAYIARLEFDKAYSVEIKIDGLPRADDMLTLPPAPYWELRTGGCETGTVMECSDARTKVFDVEPDQTYYLVVNGLLDSGGVQVQLALREIVCDPDVSGCMEGQLTSCNDTGTDFTAIGCAQDCRDETTCAGDTCADAVQVQLEPGTPTIIDGGRAAYTHTWNAEGIDQCDPYEPGPGGPSLGVEFFVSFTGLSAGQRLTLDGEQSTGNLAFYVLPECDPTSCSAAQVFNASSENALEYDVDADGDVLVAVEALGNDLDRTFSIEATVTAP